MSSQNNTEKAIQYFTIFREQMTLLKKIQYTLWYIDTYVHMLDLIFYQEM